MDRTVTSPGVVMIGGTGRSGSNILKAALARAPGACALPFETRFAVDPDGLLPAFRALNQPLTPFEAHRVLTRLDNLLRRVARQSATDKAVALVEKQIKRLGPGPVNLRAYKEWELEQHAPGFTANAARLMSDVTAARYGGIWPGRPGWRRVAQNRIAAPAGADVTRQAFARFLTDTYAAIANLAGAQTYVADETYSLFFAPEWQELLPDIRFVHILRDPRDVVASFMQQRWAPDTVAGALAFYTASMDNILTALSHVPGESVTTLRMEDLLADPKAQLQDLCAATGLTFDDAILSAGFTSGNVGRWRDDIPTAHHADLTRTLAPYVERFGYDH